MNAQAASRHDQSCQIRKEQEEQMRLICALGHLRENNNKSSESAGKTMLSESKPL